MSYLFVPAKGKGSHGKVYFGTAAKIVKDRKKELGTGYCTRCVRISA